MDLRSSPVARPSNHTPFNGHPARADFKVKLRGFNSAFSVCPIEQLLEPPAAPLLHAAQAAQHVRALRQRLGLLRFARHLPPPSPSGAMLWPSCAGDQ